MTTKNKTLPWSTEDYADAGIKYSGARKLSESAVAPLVAQARGYLTIDSHDEAKAVAERSYTTNPRRVQQMLKMMTNNGEDFTEIPWYALDRVKRDGFASKSSSTQVRPSAQIQDAAGKTTPKYMHLPGHPSVIDMNPAVTARSWLDAAPHVLITEGVIKGDSVLTAQLLAAGVAPSELLAIREVEQYQVRHHLSELLERVPPADRVPVLSLIGVGNWQQNPEWAGVSLKDRKVIVAFDGDIRQKRQVWRQAEKIFDFLQGSKSATPALLDLGGIDAENAILNAGFDTSNKLGIDDFLAQIGDWKDALKLVTSDLPPEPAATDGMESEFRVGDWRISDNGYEADRYRQVGTGENAYYSWEYGAVRMGGRVVSNSTLRSVTDPDVEDGLVHKGTVVRSGGGEVVIEITWLGESGEPQTGVVTGPQEILSRLPSEWVRIPGCEIDPAITLNPEWPPRQAKGEGWFAAIKANRAADTELSEDWDTMGYVPTTSGHPVYIVGRNVIGSNPEDERNNNPGVTEESLAKSGFYGVRDTWGEMGAEKDPTRWKQHIRENLREVVDAFTNGAVWRGPEVAPILLACALRPTAPISTGVQLYLSGAPGSGKSWAASFVMGFWQSRAGVWNETHLPGSAHDTFAAIEYARARTPIWVIDDIAPSGNRQEVERQELSVDSTIRQGFNRTGKRRSSAEGKQQRVSIPRALTLYTAENQRELLSIRQRAIDLRFERGGALDNGSGAKKIAAMTKRHDNPLSALTAAMIRFWMNVDIAQTPLPGMRLIDLEGLDLGTWSGKYQLARKIIDRSEVDIRALLHEQYGLGEQESTRRAKVFAELLFTFDVIYSLGVWAGIDPDDEVLSRLSGDPTDVKSLHGALVSYASEDLKEFRSKSNSRSLVEAIRNLLHLGEAHLTNPIHPGEPPIPAKHWNANALNSQLGWRYDSKVGAWLPSGKPIGVVGQPAEAEEGEWIASLHSQNSFMIAQRHYPQLVPFGQKASSSWHQVWRDEDSALVSPRYSPPAEGRGVQAKVRLGTGAPRINGIPLKLDVLLDGGRSDLVESSE